MGFRRMSTVVSMALVALGGTVAPAAASVSDDSKQPPFRVKMSSARCHDFSRFVEAVPGLSSHLPEDASKVPMAHIELQATSKTSSTPYEITVDGARKTRGTVGPEGRVFSGVALPEGKVSRIVVRSERHVVAERTFKVQC